MNIITRAFLKDKIGNNDWALSIELLLYVILYRSEGERKKES